VDQEDLLVGQVPVPDHDVLGPEQVGPEDAEGEEELAQVVEVVPLHVLVEVEPPPVGA
jgi:hypothetical protein